MTTDQPRLAHSRLLIAQALERDRAAHTKPDPYDTAVWLLEQLQTLGWKTPPEPATHVPPLRPERSATAEQRAARKAQIDAALTEARQKTTATPRTTLA